MAARFFSTVFTLKTAVVGVILLLIFSLAMVFALGLEHRTIFLPGETSEGHYLFEASCNSCHDGFKPVTNETCTRCHHAELVADTHGTKKFQDPRWASELTNLDALTCTACHAEHVHMFGRGVHLKADLCMACHASIPEGELQSHQGFDPAGCWTAGCHNYHDHRSISTGFLVESLDQLPQLPDALLPERQPEIQVDEPPDADMNFDLWESLS